MGDPSHPAKPGSSASAIPDLDLDLPPRAARDASPAAPPAARPAPAPAKAAPAASGGAFDYFGTGFDEDHFGAGGGSVGSSGTDAPATSGAYAGGADFEDDAALAGGSIDLASYRPPAPAGIAAPTQAGGAPPAATAPPRVVAGVPSRGPAPVVQVDTSAASVLANYGPPPKAIYLAPMYAWRVLTRQRALRLALVRVNLEHEAAEAKRDQLLASLVTGQRARLEGDSRFESSFAAVRQLEAIAGERGAALSQTNAQFEAQKAELTGALANVQKQVDERRVAERAALDEVTRAEELSSRASAKQKRAQIEARSLTQQGQTAAGGPNLPIPAEFTERIRALEAQAQSMQPEVDALRQELAQAQTALSGVRQQLGTLAQYTRRIQDQERAISRQFGKQIGQHSAGLTTAQKELTSALANVGRTLLASREGFDLDPAALAEIAATERETARLAESSELHLRALDVHDADAVKRGIILVVVLVVLVLVLLGLLIAFA